MRAAVYEGKEQLIVRDVNLPVLEPGEMLVKVDVCSVCGTDLRTYRHGDPKISVGRVLGHEFCGTVVESRAPASSVVVGDRVVMYIVLACGECRYCQAGRANLCEKRTTMSYHHDGAFAEYLRIPARAVQRGQLYAVQSDISSAEMSLAEPLGCVMHAHTRLGVGPMDTVAVIGAGPIGIMHAVLARLQGAQKVYVLDVSPARLEMARAFDLDGTVQVSPDGAHLERVRELTGGSGADVVIVAASVASAQADALELAGKGGRVNFFAGLPKSRPTAELNTNLVHYKELEISASYSENSRDFGAAVALIEQGRFPSKRIVTHTLPLERITEAFPLMESGEALKVAITL